VSEKETATARRDGEPLTSAAQERRQEETAAAEHQAAGSCLPHPGRGQLLKTYRTKCARTLEQAIK
jgi:hypothetical protein